ncbi:class I SAM-dependent methyltransferase [Halobacterium litoreum]|uniref:Methyltransferase, FkbM family n=1 Tax=Halobacterium litoreum TaxID=2039234 RepID=A0ABD5NBT4_9EURY|nr:hypothetical protein [Halobacterium litoreum]UHH14729.1 hypothetical protein LT972_06930 [Halobacterium litoreum]
MPGQSLPTRVWEIYSEEGLISLLNSIQSYIRNKTHSNYTKVVNSLKRFTPDKSRQLELNDVVVPVNINLLDVYSPYYEPAYPTENDPEYEYTEVESLKSYAEKGDEVVVIGGGLGVTAVVASKVTDSKVTAFEQSKQTYEILSQTIELNDCTDKVDIELAAVGEVAGSNFTQNPPSDVNRVPASKLPHADVYEMDCEGAETAILQKMDVKPSVLLVETHNNHSEVVDILNSKGYDVVEVVENGKNQHPSCTHIRAQLSID